LDFANHLILLASGLMLLSIFAGIISSRIGAPLLLVFLGLGMLAGEDGPGGIVFNNYEMTYFAGSLALAVILFDGGLRTSFQNVRIALTPSLTLATIGVLLTAILTGFAAVWLFDLSLLEGMLIGSIVASTDAAAVFFLLHLKNMRLQKRVNASLELESGLNDPMAVFLTLTFVHFLQAGIPEWSLQSIFDIVLSFFWQLAGGGILGFLCGYLLLILTNRLNLASGLYPILALSAALLIFSGAQEIGASGFMAAYIAGCVFGNSRHRAHQLTNRFFDGLAWLAQIIMFLLLGLLVTPSTLAPVLLSGIALALFLILVGRPLAVFLCLWPFGFSMKEKLFVSWVGLRGAVPIFLGTIPVLAGVENADLFFSLAYIIVLISLSVQGWSLSKVGKSLNLELPPVPSKPRRAEIDIRHQDGSSIIIYTVEPMSFATRTKIKKMPFSENAQIVNVIRDGVNMSVGKLSYFLPGDHVILSVQHDKITMMDRLFGTQPVQKFWGPDKSLIDESLYFVVDGSSYADLLKKYGLILSKEEDEATIHDFMKKRLRGKVKRGDIIEVGEISLTVLSCDGNRITRVGISYIDDDMHHSPLLWFIRRIRGFIRRNFD